MKKSALLFNFLSIMSVLFPLRSFCQDTLTFRIVKDDPGQYNLLAHIDLGSLDLAHSTTLNSGLGLDVLYKKLGIVSVSYSTVNPLTGWIIEEIYSDQKKQILDLNLGYNVIDQINPVEERMILYTSKYYENGKEYETKHSVEVTHLERTILGPRLGYYYYQGFNDAVNRYSVLLGTQSLYAGVQFMGITNYHIQTKDEGNYVNRQYIKAYLDLFFSLNNKIDIPNPNIELATSGWGFRIGMEGNINVKKTPQKERLFTSYTKLEFGGRPGVKKQKAFLFITYGLAFRSNLGFLK